MSERPFADLYIDASNAIEHALARHGAEARGGVAAVRAASQAVLLHDARTSTDFRLAFQWVAEEIPYDTVIVREPS